MLDKCFNDELSITETEIYDESEGHHKPALPTMEIDGNSKTT